MAEALKAVAGERMKIVLARLTTNRFMGALTGAFVTAIIQSSSVTTVLVVGFISAGLMSTTVGPGPFRSGAAPGFRSASRSRLLTCSAISKCGPLLIDKGAAPEPFASPTVSAISSSFA